MVLGLIPPGQILPGHILDNNPHDKYIYIYIYMCACVCLAETGCKSRWRVRWRARWRNINSKFRPIELVNLIWLREVSVNGMVNRKNNVDEEVWKKYIM